MATSMDIVNTLIKLATVKPEAFQTLIQKARENPNVKKELNKAVGPVPVKNPQAGWESLMYVPTQFKAKQDKDGNQVELTDAEKRKKVWDKIQGWNLAGDVSSIVGLLANSVLSAMAGAAKGAAQTSASARQKELWGPTLSDRAAAAAVPYYQNIGTLGTNIAGVLTNRARQNAGERRAAFLQALMDSEYNNFGGVSGQFADARIKAAQPIPTIGGSQ